MGESDFSYNSMLQMKGREFLYFDWENGLQNLTGWQKN